MSQKQSSRKFHWQLLFPRRQLQSYAKKKRFWQAFTLWLIKLNLFSSFRLDMTRRYFIMWHNIFNENENEAVEAHILRHRDSKTKSHNIEFPKPKNRDIKIWGQKHHETKTWNLESRCRGFLFLESWCRGFLSSEKTPWNHDVMAYLSLFSMSWWFSPRISMSQFFSFGIS